MVSKCLLLKLLESGCIVALVEFCPSLRVVVIVGFGFLFPGNLLKFFPEKLSYTRATADIKAGL